MREMCVLTIGLTSPSRTQPDGNLSGRSPHEVFDDHLRLAQERAFGTDIARNFAPDQLVEGHLAYLEW